MTLRTNTRAMQVGTVALGGGAPVSVQTMANVEAHNEALLTEQVLRCAEAGADIVRLTVPDVAAAQVFAAVRRASPVPLVADIHFDWRCALVAIEAGADALRINPGNIGSRERIREVARAAQAKHIPIRVGVNGGSLEKDILAAYGGATPAALVESALRHTKLLEDEGFRDIVISVKASDVERTLAAYTLLAERTDCPLHLGVTEAGTQMRGTVHSSVALGILLNNGIGDTIRVSLTAAPEQEVRAGLEILRALKLRAPGAAVTSCPTCGRTMADVVHTAEAIEARLEKFYREHPAAPRRRVAVMGCVVNGPGEARDADFALCGARGEFLVYVHGQLVGRVDDDKAADEIVRLVQNS